MATATKSRSREKQQTKKRPVEEIRIGRVRAAIWENETENGTFYNVTLSRLYKDGNEWKDSSSFGRDDLPLVAKVCDQVHTWIFEQAAEKSEGNRQVEDRQPGDDVPY
ncbi:MAG: hypothetical protein SH850_01780 [Planctomycetaceae bacterium]|nr:hypothetical protein [Planctomycetaceae bacterium]